MMAQRSQLEKATVKNSKFLLFLAKNQRGLSIEKFVKGADRMANSAAPDQAASM